MDIQESSTNVENDDNSVSNEVENISVVSNVVTIGIEAGNGTDVHEDESTTQFEEDATIFDNDGAEEKNNNASVNDVSEQDSSTGNVAVQVRLINELLNTGKVIVKLEENGQYIVSQVLTETESLTIGGNYSRNWTMFPAHSEYDCTMNGSTNGAHRHLKHYHNADECGVNFELGKARSDGSHICGYRSCVSAAQQRIWREANKFPMQSECRLKHASGPFQKRKKDKLCRNRNASFLCFTCSTNDQPFWICNPRVKPEEDKREGISTDSCWFMHTDASLSLVFNK